MCLKRNTTAAVDRSNIIENYIGSTKDTLTGYLKASEITALPSDPSDTAAANAAQAYTEEYSKDISNLEGIYASSRDTKALTHTDKQHIGKVTRPDEDAPRCAQCLGRRRIQHGNDNLTRDGRIHFPPR